MASSSQRGMASQADRRSQARLDPRSLTLTRNAACPNLLLSCPLQHENARKTREEYVKLQQDITRALLYLTVCTHCVSWLLACGVADNAQERTSIAISRRAVPELCAVCPLAAEILLLEGCAFRVPVCGNIASTVGVICSSAHTCSRPGPKHDWGNPSRLNWRMLEHVPVHVQAQRMT